jgi:hypothetical protein
MQRLAADVEDSRRRLIDAEASRRVGQPTLAVSRRLKRVSGSDLTRASRLEAAGGDIGVRAHAREPCAVPSAPARSSSAHVLCVYVRSAYVSSAQRERAGKPEVPTRSFVPVTTRTRPVRDRWPLGSGELRVVLRK